MYESRLIDVYELPVAANVCNQTLREVISLSNFSMAHVTMEKGNVSLWHQHSRMSEVYFILNGQGALYHRDQVLLVESGAYQVLNPYTPHKLRNTGSSTLEHLVFAIPPFDPNDLEILEDNSRAVSPKKFSYEKPPITALDGALIYELMNADERNRFDLALAIGSLPHVREALPHYHKISEEIYYIIDGLGKVRVGEKVFDVKKGSVVYVPVDQVHALQNESDSEELRVLCVSSPAYRDGDFILV